MVYTPTHYIIINCFNMALENLIMDTCCTIERNLRVIMIKLFSRDL